MEKKYLIVAGILIAVIVVFLILGFSSRIKKSPSNALEECRTLSYNGKDALNILLFSEKKDAERYMNYFLSASPFVENKNRFNFYYIDSYNPECKLYKGIAVFCHSRELVKKAASCPYDYITVIQNSGGTTRSSSYLNVISINAQHPMSTFLHEFAHAFAGLDDEYVPASVGFSSKNCFSDCDDFGKENEECYDGCGDEKHKRSVNEGLMRTLSADSYGQFDNEILKKAIGKGTGSLLSANAVDMPNDCSDKRYYLISGKYFNGSAEIYGSTIEAGCAGGSAGTGEYNYTVSDSSGGEITLSFNPEKIFTDIQDTGKGMIEGGAVLNDEEFILTVPFDGNPKTLSIKNIDGTEAVRFNMEELNNLACRIK